LITLATGTVLGLSNVLGNFLKCCDKLPIYVGKFFENLHVISGNFWVILQTLKIIRRVRLISSTVRKCLGNIHKSFDMFRLSSDVFICKSSNFFSYLQKTSGELQLHLKYLRWLSAVFEYPCTLCLICIQVTLFCTGFAEKLHSLFSQSEFSNFFQEGN